MMLSNSVFRTLLLCLSVLLAFVAPFFFPWPYAVLLALGIGYFYPPVVLVVGALLDTLYFGGTSIPYFTLSSLLVMGILLFVQQFVKTRIMS